METKAKINKWDLVKLKKFFPAKETINKTKRQPTDWEEIFANDVTDRGLISNIYKQKGAVFKSKNGGTIQSSRRTIESLT